jgi:hypothetical protein
MPACARPVSQIEAELEALGYDLSFSELDDDTVAAVREQTMNQPRRDFEAGKLTYEQMRAEQARRYKDWVLNNMQPTRPSR